MSACMFAVVVDFDSARLCVKQCECEAESLNIHVRYSLGQYRPMHDSTRQFRIS